MKKTSKGTSENGDVGKRIEAEAHAIWLKRQKLGLPGDAVSDWIAAEKAVLRNDPAGKKKGK